ncbi:MAG: GNAT family N-acetyltransferase [Clostridiales bacterium]|nr:GNAT family N-acetyltransferase [Clostridiales bacterium]
MELQIRKADEKDLDQVEQLYHSLNDYLARPEVENGPRWSRDVYPLREHAAEGLEAGELYVAEKRGQIVGTVIYLSRQGEEYQQVDWQLPYEVPAVVIHVLAVHPDYMGCGIGAALLDHAAAVGRERGARAIRLDTYEENHAAIRLYEKCGFSCRGLLDLGLEEIYGLKWYKVFEKVL